MAIMTGTTIRAIAEPMDDADISECKTCHRIILRNAGIWSHRATNRTECGFSTVI